MYDMIRGLKNNSKIELLCFRDSELTDQHAIHILSMIEFQTE